MRREEKFVIFIFFPAIALFWAWGLKLSFAQDILFAARDSAIFSTLNQVEAKQRAVTEAMMEAQIKLAESRPRIKMAGKKEGASNLGRLASHIHPYLLLSTAFNNNIDNNREQKSSFINTITPGFQANFTGQGNSVNLDMKINNTFYDKRDTANNQNGTASLLANLLIGRYGLSISDTYFNNYGASETALVNNSDATQLKWRNTIASSLNRQFNRIGFNIGYNRVDCNYTDDISFTNDYAETTYTFRQSLYISKRTQTVFQYNYDTVEYYHDYDPSPNYHFNQYALSLTKVLSAKLTSLLKGGYKLSDYKIGSWAREGNYEFNLSYQPSIRSDCAFDYQYTPHTESNSANNYNKNTLSLSLNHRLAFNDKFKLSLSYVAGLIKYPKMANTGKNNTFTWDFSVSYVFKRWFDLTLDYANTRVISNTATKYINNTVTLKTQGRF